jgi:acetolactate synthase I/II/III large subunit
MHMIDGGEKDCQAISDSLYYNYDLLSSLGGKAMNGAEALIKTARAEGIEICFANAGTTEVPILLALDQHRTIRPVLGLFEGVCTGAADGYGRLIDKPAMVLLHLGPGFANGIANLHNARRGKTPIVAIIGEHATWHIEADAPLASDIAGLARTVSGWLKTTSSANNLPADITEAVTAARLGQIASLIVPNDFQWAPCDDSRHAPASIVYDHPDPEALTAAAQMLKTYGDKVALILGGRALRREGLLVAARIRTATGCRIFTDSFPAYVDRGPDLPDVARIPYFPEPATELLGPFKGAVLAGVRDPVTFFAYPGIPSFLLRDDQEKVRIGMGNEHVVEALALLADRLNAPALSRLPQSVYPAPQRPAIPYGPLTPENIGLTMAALLPEHAVVVDEGITTTLGLFPLTSGLPAHSYLTIAGGSIGYGMPCAAGAALACPDRSIINIQADGSAMYTVQALWTQAREGLNVTTLICANRGYNILRVELARAGFHPAGPSSAALIDIENPEINWIKMAEAMGVPGVSVTTAEGLAEEMRRALAEPGPHLIEMAVK